MDKRVILTVLPGSFESGFPVTLRIKSKSDPAEKGGSGRLPKTDNIVKLFNQWQSDYRKAVMSDSRIKHSPNQFTHISCHSLGSELAQGINKWLNSSDNEWQQIRDSLHYNLNQTDEILVLIQTDDSHLRQLPWHLWDLFSEKYTKAEIALSVPEYEQLKKSRTSLPKKVKILAILGHTEGINVASDKAVIQRLPNADPKFLVETQRQELTNKLWDGKWDIFFFAGHSSSKADGKTGQIYINQNDSLSLTDLKNGLKTAIEQGLQLAIFNSCDGLGLARELADLNIPLIIIMREPVPDIVAQEFLRQFLRAFAQGKSLYLAVRSARSRLQGLEDEYPCATWLPVICQNPDTMPPTWASLSGKIEPDATIVESQPQKPTMFPPLRYVRTMLIASGVIVALVMGVRYLGVLQNWELQAFDQGVRSRPDEPADNRLLVVTVTEDDLKLPEQTKRENSSLSEQSLAIVLKKLKQFQAKAIGLDIYRDFKAKDQRKLAVLMKDNPSFFAICKVRNPGSLDPGISFPPEISPERRGFSDVVLDPDRVLRRHLLAIKTKSTTNCVTPYALSVRLAFYYLDRLGIFPIYDKTTKELHLKDVTFKRLRSHAGGYQGIDDSGYQILLNYRAYNKHSPIDTISQVSLKDVLANPNQLNPLAVKDRIVIIGVTARSSSNDYFQTPYSTGQIVDEDMPGVIAQAQMTSEILSAVLDRRPLLWVWPWWDEVLWIWVWSLVGGMMAWWQRSPLQLVMVLASLELLLSVLCYASLIYTASWVPLVPSGLVLLGTSFSMAVVNARRT